MGPLLVLVSPCLEKICNFSSYKIVVLCVCVCSLDNFLLKKYNMFLFLEIEFQNGAHLKKKTYFWSTLHIFSHHGKRYKKSFNTYLTYTHVFCSPFGHFRRPNFEKIDYSYAWFLFGVTAVVDSYFPHFRAIVK